MKMTYRDICKCGHNDYDHAEDVDYEDNRDEFEMHCRFCKCDGFRYDED